MARGLKQFLYGIFYLVFFAALGSGFYFLFLKPAPSCFDKVQNQNEMGVDCGGVCSLYCLPAQIRPIELQGNPQVVYLDNDHSSLLMTIQNPNAEVGADSFEYHVTLFDTSGAMLWSNDESSFIYPEEIRYIAIPVIDIPAAKIGRVEVAFQNANWVPRDHFSRPRVVIKNSMTNNLESNITEVVGQVANEDTRRLKKIFLLSVFYGELGQIAGVSGTELENIAPGEAREFVLSHPIIVNIDPTATKVFAFGLPI